MAYLRSRPRADGTTAYVVNYRHKGAQSTLTFDTESEANTILRAIETLGAERTLIAFGIGPAKNARKKSSSPTIAELLDTHVDNLTGIAKSTLYDYRAYIKNDIKPALGDIPADLITQADIAGWIQAMHAAGSSGKTIANKHGLLSAALSSAVRAGVITDNPAAGNRMPRSEKLEMVFLTPDEYPLLRQGFTPYWHPLIDFLVASGARFGEVAALRPTDVDRQRGTVYIGRAMKRTYDEDRYEIGPTKTKRSVRTISVDEEILNALDYSHPTLFANTKGGALRVSGWRTNVWYPSVARAQKLGLKKQPRIHDMRHTCASWMISEGVPLPDVQAHLGHENIQTTTALYYHLDRRQADKAAAVIGAKLRGSSQ